MKVFIEDNMNKDDIKKLYELKTNLLELFEKNNSIKNITESFNICDKELTNINFKLLNTQNNILIDDMEIRMYVNTSFGTNIVFFVIFSHATNSMFFPISVEKNCPKGLIKLSKIFLDKTIYKKENM